MDTLHPRTRWLVAGLGSAALAVAAAWVVAGAPVRALGEVAALGPGAALGDAAGLEVEADARRFPVIGSVVAAFAPAGAPRRAPLGLTRFGWGGEAIAVTRLQVPDWLLDVPLVLTADGEGGYLLRTQDGVALADGAVGREVAGRDPRGGEVRILVRELVARPGTEFEVRKRCCAGAIAAARGRGR